MMRRFLRSRGARKFLRSRLAIAALAIICLYGGLAVAVAGFGLIEKSDTRDETSERVGPKNLPGFFRPPAAETRLENCAFYLESIERALKRQDVEALRAIAFAERKVAAKPLDELEAAVEEAWELYEEIADVEDLNAAPESLPRIAELETKVDALFAPLTGADAFWYSARVSLGTDQQGRSILMRAVYAIKIAVQVGTITALISVLFGSLLGAAAGFFGGWVDHIIIWLYSTFSAIPNLVLLTVLVFMFTGSAVDGTLIPLFVAFCMTFWIGPCRVVRGEVLKLKQLEFVQAATTIGFGRWYILLRHILPNTTHLMFINFSLLFIAAVKSEVILTFLGLGVKSNVASWGVMIKQAAPEVVTGFFWQIGTVIVFMFGLVLAFNVLSDALQDAFDPKSH